MAPPTERLLGYFVDARTAIGPLVSQRDLAVANEFANHAVSSENGF